MESRMSFFKLIVMRKVQETRMEKAKPKLGQLLKGLKGGLRQKMETRKKILELYENDEVAKAKAKKQKEDELKKFVEEGDDKNKTYVEIKCRIMKAYDDLEEQDHILMHMREKIMDCLGPDGFFMN